MRKSAARNPQSDPNPTRNSLHSRRRIRNPEIRFPFSSAAAAAVFRQRKAAAAATPQLSWKFSDSEASDPPRVAGQGKLARKAEAVSARKLAAGIWHSELLESEVGPSKNQSSVVLPGPSTEMSTKWDTKHSKPSNDVSQSFHHLKPLIDQQMTQASSLESKLTAELDWARARIDKLESKRHSSSKKLERALKKHAEEKASWRLREQEKIQAVIDGMQGDLSLERRSRRRTEVLNSKLLDELAEAKKQAKRFMHDYEKEKKARELLEDVCDQLAKEVGEDRAEVEESKRESMRARDELEEERKMLQMAEVWREERVQMKLVDAKLALESRCSQLMNLQAELESFLRARRHDASDVEEIKEAEMLIEAVAESVKVEGTKEFTYKPPPASEDIFSIFEELQQQGEPKEREIEQCYSGRSHGSDGSDVHTVSPATDIFLGKPANGSMGDDSEWETLSHGDIGSSNSLELGSGDDELRKSVSSISKLWPSCPDSREGYKKASAEAPKDVGGFSPPNMENWSPPELVNPHVTRGMKGCIEWPRGVNKQSLKTKLMEAKLESHKVQIRHVLKQKI